MAGWSMTGYRICAACWDNSKRRPAAGIQSWAMLVGLSNQEDATGRYLVLDPRTFILPVMPLPSFPAETA